MTKAEAIAHFGSVRKLADALGIASQAIHQWRDVPALRQLQLELMTKGRIKADPEIKKPN